MRKYFVTGIIILVPILFTIMLFFFLVNFFTSPFLNVVIDFLKNFKLMHPLVKNPALLTFVARIIIILCLCLFVFLLGIVARGFIFNALMTLANKIMSKIPFVKSIYKAIKDITVSFASKERKAFTKTAMIKFPSTISYGIGFETGEAPQECSEKIKQKLKPVWIPTAPHPLSSLMVLVPQDKIQSIELSKEDAVKYIVSCGLILPGEKLEDAIKK